MKNGNIKKKTKIRPTRIYFAPFDYSVHYSTSIGADNHGETNRDTKEMTVQVGISEPITKETVVHESCHVLVEDLINFVRNYNTDAKDDEVEEAFVRIFSPRLFQYIQNNPALMQYIMKKD